MRKKLLLITMILLGAVFLSSCVGGAVRGSSWPGLTVSGDVAYLADGPLVYAVNLKDGRELWHYPEKGGSKQVFYSTPVVTPDGLIIVGSAGTDHSLIAINPNDINPENNTPIEAWIFTGARDHWVAAPLIIDNLLFAPNSDGNLYVLDLSDGSSNKQAVKIVELSGRLWSQPVTNGERIFVTSLDHSVFGVDLQTYEYWHEDLAGAIPTSPAIGSDGMLYVGSLAAQLEKFDPATGKHQPVLDVNDWLWNTPVMDADTLYFGDLGGNFYSFNTSTSELNWPSVQPDGPITATPVIMNDSILLATESGSIFELTKDGRSTLWSQPGGQIYTTPVLAGDLVLVSPLGAENYLYAYDGDGHQAWAFTPGK